MIEGLGDTQPARLMWLFLLLVICFLTLVLFQISAAKVAVDDPSLEVKVGNPVRGIYYNSCLLIINLKDGIS